MDVAFAWKLTDELDTIMVPRMGASDPPHNLLTLHTISVDLIGPDRSWEGFVPARNRVQDLFSYWHAVETFTPQTVPRVLARDHVYRVTARDPLPWNSEHSLAREQVRDSGTWLHTVYCGVFDIDLISKTLEEVFGRDLRADEERPRGDTALLCLRVDDDGTPLTDTVVSSSAAWAVSLARKHGAGVIDRLRDFNEANARLLEAAQVHLAPFEAPDIPDESADNVQDKQATPLAYADLQRLLTKARQVLGVSENLAPDDFRVRSVRVPKKANAAEEQDFLNSFIRPDLARVGDAAARKNLGKALLAYVEHGVFDRDLRRCNVREQLDETYRLLRPGDIPCARWVSDGGKSLALGQQLAVNVAMRQLAHTGGGLLAVNGPPGTGKTTMLREVLAALLVERANRLATLKSPGDAFGAECGWTTSQRKRTFRLLRPEVTGFEIVVASANNGAVQNVTREIPLTEAVDGDWQSTAEYFPDLATGVFDASAWAMVAAELGSKDRRSRFVQDFWWGRRARGSEPARPGLKELLSGFETRPKVNWREAVSRFKAVFAQAQGLQAERERAYEAATALEELQPAIDGLSSGLRRLSAQRSDMNQALDVRQTALAAAEESLANWSSKKIVHQAAKPSTFSSRAAKSAWREAGDQLSISLSNAQQGATAAQRFVEQMGQQARALDGQIQETRGRLQERQMRRNALQAQAASARGRLGQAFQERWSALPEDDRELTAPWLDEEWNDARTRVFLEALALHEAFIRLTSQTLRWNLQAAMDVLSGEAPKSAPSPAVAAAWQSLFLVVPMVSTTFASFGNLFSHLQKEALGWVFIDEAGQATPQQAVGALYRSQRAVIVGDPQQLEPIVAVPYPAQASLARAYGLPQNSQPSRGSVQILADRATPLGTCISRDDEWVWVGIPLRVHRRCDQPMFDIANEIAYSKLMVFGTPDRTPLAIPPSQWIDVQATHALGNWVPEEGEVARSILTQLLQQGIPASEVIAITPFRAVALELRRLFQEKYRGLRIGTIHTAQGREAEIVVLVLGTSPERKGSRDWAASKPNLLNVAVTRAKRRIYVIGNYNEWAAHRYFDKLASLPVTTELS